MQTTCNFYYSQIYTNKQYYEIERCKISYAIFTHGIKCYRYWIFSTLSKSICIPQCGFVRMCSLTFYSRFASSLSSHIVIAVQHCQERSRFFTIVLECYPPVLKYTEAVFEGFHMSCTRVAAIQFRLLVQIAAVMEGFREELDGLRCCYDYF